MGHQMKISLREKLRDLRQRHGYTYRDLYDKTGLSTSHLWSMEKGKISNLTMNTIQQLAKAYNLEMEFFL